MARWVFIFCCFSFLLVACRVAPPDLTPTATETAVSPTHTLAPTRTPAPPTATPRPLPTATPLPLEVTLEGELEPGILHLDATLGLHFNQPMHNQGVSNPLHITPALPGEFIWDETNTFLSFTPTDRFAPNQFYTVEIAPELTAESGATFSSPPKWQFSTIAIPKVSNITPSTTVYADLSPTFELTFNHEMNWESVVTAFQGDPDVFVTLGWLAENGEVQYATWPDTYTPTAELTTEPGENQLIVQVDTDLNFEQPYHFVLAETAVDLYGLPLSGAYEWSYQPASLAMNASYSNNTNLAIVLNYRLDLTSTLQALIVDPPIKTDWQIEWQGNTTIISLKPDVHLPGDTAYSIQLEGALFTANGRLLPPPPAAAIITPPVITAVFPEPQEWVLDYADPATTIEINFNRPMDEQTTNAALDIFPPVVGEFEWINNRLIFHPVGGHLNGYESYRVTLQPTAKDAQGYPILSQPYSWSFTTDELYSAADFGPGYKIQIVDAEGRRAVQYRSFETQPVTVTFSLYDLSQEQAIQMFRNYLFEPGDAPLFTTWTAVTVPGEDPYNNPQEVILPGDVPPGPYLLTLDADTYHDKLLIFLTQNVLAVKRAETQLTAWTTNINGTAVGDLEVSVWNAEGQELVNGRTDGMGVFQTPLPPEVDLAYVLARNGDDLVITGFDHNWGTYQYSPLQATYLAYIYTDRPIYRPGQLVYFRAILRQNADALLNPLPTGTAVTAQLRDAKNNLVQSLSLTANHFGTVYGQFQLAEGAMLGDYHVQINLPGETTAWQLFKVQDYRKPDYEVIVTTDSDRYLVGEPISVTVEARYFFGEPVANAEVQVYLFSKSSYWGDWYTFDEPLMGQTDRGGRFSFTLDPNAGAYAIEATIDDGSHQNVSGFRPLTVYWQAETLHLNSGTYYKSPNSPIPVQVGVQDIFGEPVANRDVTLQLRHYDPALFNMVDVENFNGVTDENGRFDLTLTPPQLGYYELHAFATDQLGNQLKVTRYFFVYDPADRHSQWYGRNDSLTVSTSQESYAPGETAQVFIQSTFAGTALLTIERATVHRQQLIELTPPMTVVDLPLVQSDTPNVFVNVMAWKPVDTAVLGSFSQPDSQLVFAQTQLNISLAHKTLNITITPNQEQYQPGQQATVTLRVTNAQGDPVSAELSLAVVDEAIFNLSPELTGSMLDTFYYKRPNQVNLFNALLASRRLWYTNPEESGGGGGGGGDEEGISPTTGSPRQEFQDTSAWFPALQTDANGQVVVTFTLPDNLTRWRLTARAVTADTQVGETATNITTWKPVVVRPILPRTLTAGDTLGLSAIVHNNGDTPQELTVSLAIENLTLLQLDQANIQEFSLAAGESQVVGWPLTAVSPGTVTLTVQVNNPDGVLDAVAMPLTIRPLAIPNVTAQIGQFSGSFTTDITQPQEALDISTVQIDLNRSIAGSMVQGLEYLTGYPYGCVEQTMSRALPNAVVARAFQQLGVSDPALLADLQPLVQASIQRLYSFQHNDGGWGWWEGDSSHDYQTAWVVFGLTVTAQAGYEIDPEVIARGVAWLQIHLAEMDIRTRAFALYSLALAGHGELAATQALLSQKSQLDTFSQAALALTLHELGETADAQTLVDDLAETATNAGSYVFWQSDTTDGHYQQKTMASATRSTALALSAFVQIRPGHAMEPGIVRWLMSQRQDEGWGNTNETAFTILALTDHLVAVQETAETAETVYTINLNGQTILTGTLSPNALSAHVEIPALALSPGTNQLTIQHDGLLYYVITNHFYLAQAEIEADGMIEVSRFYLDVETGKPIITAVPNQLVQVQITVQLPTDASYIIVEDSLPGGLEALNEQLDTTTLLAEDGVPYWQQLGYNHKEIRADRVSFFITDMEAGSHTFTYYGRITHTGQFVAMPVEVYAMYNASLWGRSASQLWTITAD